MKVEELRSSLQEHADAVSTGSPLARVASVHERVTRARRRRSTATAAVAVAVLVVIGAGVLPRLAGDAPQPADGKAPSRLAGHPVPRTQTATGFTFDYARGEQSRPGAKRLVLRLPDSDLPRLVMWASSDQGSRPTVRLRDTYGADERSAPGGFGRYFYLGGGRDRVVLTQADAGPETRLALATYTLSKTPPPGVSNGTVTYRRQIAGKQLLGARLGRPGDSDLRLRFTVPRQRVWLSDVCYGAHAYYQVSVAGKMMLGSSCSTAPALDPGAGGMASDRPLGRPGETLELRIRLVKGMDDSTPVTDPHVVLGIGAYADRTPTVPVAGTREPATVEMLGHRWEAVLWHGSDPGAGESTLSMSPTGTPQLVTVVRHGLAPRSTVVVSAGGRRVNTYVERPTGSEEQGDPLVIQPGDSPQVVVRATRGLTPRSQVGLVVYEQVR